MAHTIHAGDESTDCGVCQQNARIKDNMDSDLDYALESGDFDMFMDIFEDRDPFEFL
jgi:hypothetical protein